MASKTSGTPDHVDVLIIGAGLSGVGAAAHLRTQLPDRSFAILERREAVGGTWDLFRYPGVRSDSDMHTLGYRLRPWDSDDVLASGPAIKQYVADTADQFGVTPHIRHGHHVKTAEFDRSTGRWSVGFEVDGVAGSITANFLWACSGYYNYDEPFDPQFPGEKTFAGEVVHPQHWPEDLDFSGKKVVVIGSGATAVTLVPAMSGTAAKVTMLQRSPSYVLSIPSRDPLGPVARTLLPGGLPGITARWRNVLIQSALYQSARRRPREIRALLLRGVKAQLPKGYDVDTHFSPSYDPWDQRLCMVPDGDLFKAIRTGKAEVVTGHIATFTPTGIRLTDGSEVEADIIVTATGLKMELMGGVELSVDGVVQEPKDHLVYKGCMLDGIPNFAFVVGYTNSSWTLKADLIAGYVVRLLRTMKARDASVVAPVRSENVRLAPIMPLAAGYIQRAAAIMPQAGDKHPWEMSHNYLLDIPRLRRGKVDDGVLEFG